MNRKIVISIGAAVVILVLANMVSGKLSSMATKEEVKAVNPVPTVAVMDIETKEVAVPVRVYGTLRAQQRIDLLAEVSGTAAFAGQPFVEGAKFAQGEPLLVLNNIEAKAAAQNAQTALLNALASVLPEVEMDYSSDFKTVNTYYEQVAKGNVANWPYLPAQLEQYLIARGVKTAYFNATSAAERLEKFTLRAPFAAVVTLANTKPGNVVSPGKVIGTLVAPGKYEMVTSVALRYAANLKVGQPVALTSDAVPGEWTGKVKYVAPAVTRATQTVSVIVEVADANLLEGMFLSGQLENYASAASVELPTNLLFDNNHVYVVNSDNTIQKTAVEIVEWLESTVVVVGLEQGQVIVAQPITGYSGMNINRAE